MPILRSISIMLKEYYGVMYSSMIFVLMAVCLAAADLVFVGPVKRQLR